MSRISNSFKQLETCSNYAKKGIGVSTAVLTGILTFDTANYFGLLNGNWNRPDFCKGNSILFTTAKLAAIQLDVFRNTLENISDSNIETLDLTTYCTDQSSLFQTQTLYWIPAILITGAIGYRFFQGIENFSKKSSTPNPTSAAEKV